MAKTNDNIPTGTCKKCGQTYHTWSGSMLHHLKCPNVEEVITYVPKKNTNG